MNTHEGYSKKKLDNTNVLLAGGGDKSLADFVGSIQYVSASHKILIKTAADNASWLDLVTLVTTDENVKQTPKTDNVNRPLMMINGGTSSGELTSTSMFSTGIYANASSKMITANGFIKADSDNTYVLTGDGGHKAWGNANENISVNNGTVCTNLNADMLDGQHLITKVTDWNTIVNSVFKSSENSITNAPTTDYTYGTVLRFHRSSDLYVTDLVVSLYNDRMYFRRHADGVFGEWRLLIHSGNIGSLSVNYANSAGTADKLSTVSKTIWGLTYWTSSGVPTNVDGNQTINFSGGYGTYYKGPAGESSIEFYCNNTSKAVFGATSTYAFMYNSARSNYLKYNDNGTLTFEGHTIWHSGNDGSGSGLDADLLDGVLLMSLVSNWNTTTTSIFKSSEISTSNAPTTGYIYGITMRFHRSPTTYFTDLVADLYGNHLYYRVVYDGVFCPWKGIIDTGGGLTINGNLTATNFYTTSDARKKQNISSFSEHIRKFQLKDTEKWHYGVIALEVEEMFRDGEEGNMTVNYNSILSFYIGLLENRVKILEERIKRLESK